MKITINKKIKYASVALVLALMTGAKFASAQVNTLGSAYYQNQYQVNPALAGAKSGDLLINASYRKQATDIDGAAHVQAFTVEYGMNPKMGVGLNIYREKIGLLEFSRVMASYAYHLPMADNQELSFGLSAGVISQQLDVDGIKGDAGDPTAMAFDSQGATFDVDFGVAYQFNALKVQVAALHLGTYADNENIISTIRKPTYFGAASYKVTLKEAGVNSITLEPKICYRKVEDYDGIMDVGFQLGFLGDNLNFMTMYHSSQNTSMGVSFRLLDAVRLNGVYTTDAKDFDGLAGSDYEIALQILLNKFVSLSK